MKFNAQQIAAVVNGKIEGDVNTEVNTFAKIEEAKKGSLCFLSNKKYEHFLYTTQASIILCNGDVELKQPINCTLIRVPDAYTAFALLLQYYTDITKIEKKGIDEKTNIPSSVKIKNNVYIGAFVSIGEHVSIGENVKIYPNTYVGDYTVIGDNCILYPNVTVYHQCQLGKNVTLHSGTVIGCDGFGFSPSNGSYEKIPQIGNVIIEDNVEIGANCTIDRATMGSTIIKKGVKLDNLIQIGHNAVIDENTVIAAQAGVSGSSKVGKNVMIGGQAGIVGHIKIADGTRINAQSGVTKTIEESNKPISGSPAFDYKATLKSQVVFRQLPSLMQKINAMEKELEKLRNKL